MGFARLAGDVIGHFYGDLHDPLNLPRSRRHWQLALASLVKLQGTKGGAKTQVGTVRLHDFSFGHLTRGQAVPALILEFALVEFDPAQ